MPAEAGRAPPVPGIVVAVALRVAGAWLHAPNPSAAAPASAPPRNLRRSRARPASKPPVSFTARYGNGVRWARSHWLNVTSHQRASRGRCPRVDMAATYESHGWSSPRDSLGALSVRTAGASVTSGETRTGDVEGSQPGDERSWADLGLAPVVQP